MASLQPAEWQAGVGTTLRGKTLGIYGYGRIGKVVAGYGRAFEHEGARLGAPGVPGARPRRRVLRGGVEASALFAESDVLSLHMRLVPATRGIVTRADLARMKPDAILVNTSRAGLVEPGALVSGAARGPPRAWRPSTYIEEEPLRDVDHPLLRHGQRRLHAPHRVRHARGVGIQFADVFDQVNAYAAGAPTNVVNPEVLSRARPRP